MIDDNKPRTICYDLFVDFENIEKFDEFIKNNSVIIRLVAKDNKPVFSIQLIDAEEIKTEVPIEEQN